MNNRRGPGNSVYTDVVFVQVPNWGNPQESKHVHIPNDVSKMRVPSLQTNGVETDVTSQEISCYEQKGSALPTLLLSTGPCVIRIN
jgi:hypothetical protein